MSYVLSGLIADRGLLEAARVGVVVPLSGGVAFVPLTESFWRAHGLGAEPMIHAWKDSSAGAPRRALLADDSPFWRATAAVAAASASAPVAYVEASFWAGDGDQAAVVWRKGERVLGPMVAYRAINQALRELGVAPTTGDEFDAVGLGRHRMTEDWLAPPDEARGSNP